MKSGDKKRKKEKKRENDAKKRFAEFSFLHKMNKLRK